MKTNKTRNTLSPKKQPNKKNTTQNPRIFYSKLLSNWCQITIEDQVLEKISKDLKVWSITTKYYCNGKNVGKLREVLEMYLLPNKMFTWNQMFDGSSNKLSKHVLKWKMLKTAAMLSTQFFENEYYAFEYWLLIRHKCSKKTPKNLSSFYIAPLNLFSPKQSVQLCFYLATSFTNFLVLGINSWKKILVRAQRKGKQQANNLEHREKLGYTFDSAKAEAGDDANSTIDEEKEWGQNLVKIPAVLACPWLSGRILYSSH